MHLYQLHACVPSPSSGMLLGGRKIIACSERDIGNFSSTWSWKAKGQVTHSQPPELPVGDCWAEVFWSQGFVSCH